MMSRGVGTRVAIAPRVRATRVRSPVRSTRMTVHGIGYLVRKYSMTVHDKSAHAYDVYGSLSFSNKKPMYGLKQHTTKQPYLK